MLFEVQCEVSTVCDDLGCHVICWCWSTVFSEVHSQHRHLPGNFRALHALWRCWFHFPAGLGTCPHCQRYQKLVQWPWCYCAWLASKLAWPEPRRESIQYRWPEGRYQSNLGFHYTWAVPQADCLYATAIIFLETLPNSMWWCRCCLTSLFKVFWPRDSTIFCNSPAVVLGESLASQTLLIAVH